MRLVQAAAHHVDACEEAFKRSHRQKLHATLTAIIMSLRARGVRQHTRAQLTIDHSRVTWASGHKLFGACMRRSRALAAEGALDDTTLTIRIDAKKMGSAR